MAKITVTANKDFFDRGNNIQRTKGQSFILKSEYAESLGDLVKFDKVEKKAVKKEEVKTEGKDMTMANIKKESAPGQKVSAEKKAGNEVKQTAKKAAQAEKKAAKTKK